MKVYVHYEEGSDAELHVTLKLTLPKKWNGESPVKLLQVHPRNGERTVHVTLLRYPCRTRPIVQREREDARRQVVLFTTCRFGTRPEFLVRTSDRIDFGCSAEIPERYTGVTLGPALGARISVCVLVEIEGLGICKIEI